MRTRRNDLTSEADERWMQLALALARRGEGLTRPNPPVGAVIVRSGRMVGSGWHRRAGAPHAEVIAIRRAGRLARGATLYVTLEPCSTWGRTPPCTDTVVAAGLRRVVVATTDPNPRHRGRGLRLLRRAGLDVTSGVCDAEARALIAPFASWVLRSRPMLTLKLGVSVDGRIADWRGRSRWITGPAARRATHALRRQADAIMVGAGTALGDDPSLLPVPDRGRRPFRVVVDAAGRLPGTAKLLTDRARLQTIIATTRNCPTSRRRLYEQKAGAVWVLPSASSGVALGPLLRRLGQLGVLRVLCEGGGELAASLVRAGLVDEFCFHIAPIILGGCHARPAFGGRGWSLDCAPCLRFVEIRMHGQDLLIRAVPRGGSGRGGRI